MADPEARVVVTASDQTARVFASADRNIKSFARGVYSLRSVFAGFGVIVSGRMFANWIKDAIEVEKLTKDQAAAIGSASKAVAVLNTEFQNLARTAVTELAPKLEHAAKFWRELFFPTEGERVDEQFTEMTKRALELSRALVSFEEGRSAPARGASQIANMRKELEDLQRAMTSAREERDRLLSPTQMPNLLAGISRIGDFADRHTGAKRPQVSIDFLDEFEEMTVQARRISEDELLRPFPEAEVRKLFEPIKKEAEYSAEVLGETFKDSFADWMIGTERDFKDLLKRMAAQLATSALFQGLGSVFPAGGFFSRFFGGFRAGGGPVSAGKGYIVGERGPEWFMPGQSGMISPGGAIVIHQSNSFSGGDVRQQAAAIAANNARLKQELKAEISDSRRRGRPI